MNESNPYSPPQFNREPSTVAPRHRSIFTAWLVLLFVFAVLVCWLLLLAGGVAEFMQWS